MGPEMFYSLSAGIDFGRQNLTFIDVRPKVDSRTERIKLLFVLQNSYFVFHALYNYEVAR